MELVHPIAEQYAQSFTSKFSDVIKEVEDFTLQHHPHAHMCSGHVQGKVLEMLSSMIQPQRILEVGTFTGLSALCLAGGLQEGGTLHTIELRKDDALKAQQYFEKAGATNIVQHIGDAISIIPTLHEEWDMVFLDADKPNYINYYELILPSVKKDKWIIADNVFFHGQVFADDAKGKNALAIHAFNQHVASDDRVEQVILTVRDGLMLIKKK